MNDNMLDEPEELTEKEKKRKTDTWTIRNIPDDIRDKLVTDAKSQAQSIGEYITYLVESYDKSITNVSKEAKDAAMLGAESLGMSVAAFIDMILLNQNTTIRNVDHEALSAAMMVSGRLNIPMSQFVSNAIIKEAHSVLQGKNNNPVATLQSSEIMTVDKVETLIRDLKSEMIEIIKEIKKDQPIEKETFFNKIKEKIFK